MGWIKQLLKLIVETFWGYRVYNPEALKSPGPVLLIPNHVSWLDWLFLMVTLDEDWRCVVSSSSAEHSWLHRKIMLNSRTFPIDTTSPFAVKKMAEFLSGNGRLVLFAEGRISRTGSLMKLFEGTGFLLYNPVRHLTRSPHKRLRKSGCTHSHLNIKLLLNH